MLGDQGPREREGDFATSLPILWTGNPDEESDLKTKQKQAWSPEAKTWEKHARSLYHPKAMI